MSACARAGCGGGAPCRAVTASLQFAITAAQPLLSLPPPNAQPAATWLPCRWSWVRDLHVTLCRRADHQRPHQHAQQLGGRHGAHGGPGQMVFGAAGQVSRQRQPEQLACWSACAVAAKRGGGAASLELARMRGLSHASATSPSAGCPRSSCCQRTCSWRAPACPCCSWSRKPGSRRRRRRRRRARQMPRMQHAWTRLPQGMTQPLPPSQTVRSSSWLPW